MTDDEIYRCGILVVDDEPHIREHIGDELSEAGFKKLYYASNGLECVNKLREYRDDIYLIIMDIRLGAIPKDEEWDEKQKNWQFDGLETIRHLTNIWHEVVGVLFYTAYDTYREEADEIGSDKVMTLGYYVKSIDTNPLIDAVKKNLQLVTKKRLRLISDKDSYLIQYIEKNMAYFKDELKSIYGKLDILDEKINKIRREQPSLLKDIGKSVIVAIILALFVILYLHFSLGDIVKQFLPTK